MSFRGGRGGNRGGRGGFSGGRGRGSFGNGGRRDFDEGPPETVERMHPPPLLLSIS